MVKQFDKAIIFVFVVHCRLAHVLVTVEILYVGYQFRLIC